MTGNLENVGFAREGHFGIYNILVMEEVQDVVAIGPGGISKHLIHENIKDDQGREYDIGNARPEQGRGGKTTGENSISDNKDLDYVNHMAGSNVENSRNIKIIRAENVRDLDSYVNRLDEMLQRKKELFGC